MIGIYIDSLYNWISSLLLQKKTSLTSSRVFSAQHRLKVCYVTIAFQSISDHKLVI